MPYRFVDNKWSFFFVEMDGTISQINRDTHKCMEEFDLRHVYITVTGALRDSRCLVEATAIESIENVPMYDTREVMENGWRVANLKPVFDKTVIKLEK
jgi:hypothetical protein